MITPIPHSRRFAAPQPAPNGSTNPEITNELS